MKNYRDELIKLLDEGIINPQETAFNLLCWLSEDDCKDYARIYDLKDLINEQEEQ